MLTAWRPQQQRWVTAGEVSTLPVDMTCMACARVRAAELDAALARAEQWFPIDGPDDGDLGLMVEGDSTGPLRMGFGGWRDLLLGVQFEDGLGRLVSVGGRVMKNVAGYDLTKFMVGQRGVFGRVVAVAVRTYRRPAAALAARFSSPPELAALRPMPAWAIETRGGVWAGWLGDEPLVTYAADSLAGTTGVQLIRQGLTEDRALRQRLWSLPEAGSGKGEGLLLRAWVPPGRVGAFVVEARVKEWVADPWHGQVLMRVGEGQAEAVRRAAWATGGRAEVQSEAAGESTGVMVSEREAAVLRRLKQQFDPDNTLAPLRLEVVT